MRKAAKTSEKRSIYKFSRYFGRAGDLSGVFAARPSEVEAIIGRRVRFGEALGKHSDVRCTIDEADIKRVTSDPRFVALFIKHGLDTGTNPVDVAASNAEEEDAEIARTAPTSRGPSTVIAVADVAVGAPATTASSAGIDHTMPRGAAIPMRYVPAGKFTRGSEDGDSDEKPTRVCEITRGFYVAEHPTTVGEFRAFMEATPYVTTAEREGDTRTWRAPGFAQTDDHPVVCVSWDDAQAFCAWAGLRLLTETEWEYTARGSDGRTYPWGNEAPDNTHLVWSGSGTSRRGTAPVGQCPAGASPFGVLDLAGNVWEWCADWYGTYSGGKSTIPDPTGHESGICRVLRGASWGSGDAWFARAADRFRIRPSLHIDFVGFRAARGEV